MGGLDLSAADFVEARDVVQLGVQPRVDLVTAIDGVKWDEAWQGKFTGDFGPVPTQYLGRREFVANKQASGRRKDLADLEALDEK